MSKQPTQEHAASLVSHLIDLANEIDGVVDFGMTVCFLKEEEMAGRHRYIDQRCDAIRRIVNSVITAMSDPNLDKAMELSASQSDLIAATDQLLAAFRALERFRSLRPASVRSWADAVRTGWETTHGVIRRIADSLHLPDQAWYFPILERHDSYRTHLEGVCTCFFETAAASIAEQNPTGSAPAE
jgi:hypothetical protein